MASATYRTATILFAANALVAAHAADSTATSSLPQAGTGNLHGRGLQDCADGDMNWSGNFLNLAVDVACTGLPEWASALGLTAAEFCAMPFPELVTRLQGTYDYT